MKKILSFILLIFTSVSVWGKDSTALAKSDSLFAKGVELYNLQKYKEAIPFFEESDRIDQTELDSASNRRDYSTMWLASCYYIIGNEEQAMELNADYYMVPPIDRRLTIASDSILAVALEFYNNEDYFRALEKFKEVAEIEKSVLGENNFYYAKSLSNIASAIWRLTEYAEAVKLQTEVLNIEEMIESEENSDFVESLIKLADYNYFIDGNTEAIRLQLESLNIIDRIAGKQHPDYLSSLHDIVHYYSDLGNYEEAIKYEIEVLNIQETTIGKEHSDYIESLNDLAFYYSRLGEYREAIKFMTEVLNIQETTIGKEHSDYIESLNDLARYYALLMDYREAIKFKTEVLNTQETTIGKEQPDYVESLLDMALYYSIVGDYKEAVRFGTEALDISERSLGKEDWHYTTTLNNLAGYYAALGDIKKSIRLGTEVLEIEERVWGKEGRGYITGLNNLGLYYAALGDYSKAITLGKEALDISERILGREDWYYTTTLNNIGLYYSFLKDYKKAITLVTEALDISERILGKKNYLDYMYLNNLAMNNYALGNYEESLRLGTEALNAIDRIAGKEHPEYAMLLGNLAYYYSTLGAYKEAITLGSEVLDINERFLGKEHLNYIRCLRGLAYYYFKLGNKNETTALINETLPLFSNYIKSNFSGLTTQERSNFWDINKSFFEVDINIYPFNINSESLISTAYDATLLSKGILLSTEMEFSNILQESGDDKITELYNELRSTRLMLNMLYQKPISERQVDTDSLERVANTLERDLIERSKEYGDFTRNMTISWRDVQSKLKQKDLAVEFVSFPIENDSTIYAAYVINPQMETPEMVSLFEAKDLSKIEVGNYYNTTELSKLVWNNLDPYLKDAENVYFAPTGELYKIAIEYLPYYKSEGLMSDFHNFYRLSSTRELAVTKVKNDYTQAVLYGGMKFGTKKSFLKKDMEKYPKLKNRDFSIVNVAGSLELRDGVKYLPGTAVEVDNIERYLQKTSVKPLLYKGQVGTEASFKSLSGRKVNIIHLATHGFFCTEDDARRAKDDISFLMPVKERGLRYFEDKALTLSGLLFSGANNSLKGIALPENVEDGILTAKEIAELDFRGLDLVVLSACQTGLGEITGDGVFGLQRGFKKAGANSILMSLWKVDDKATQMLMTKFYEEFLGGKSKYEALKSAQKYLREYQPKGSKNDRPYADPYFWAAFILLDALN